MGKWTKSPDRHALPPLRRSVHREISVLERGPGPRSRARHSSFGLRLVVYIAGILAISVYWYSVFSSSELAIDVPKQPSAPAKVTATIAKKVEEKPKVAPLSPLQRRLVAAAKEQLKRKIRYSDRYHRLSYPNGDVPAGVGMSIDVVIRVLRSIGVDLQRRIHEDLMIHPSAYPRYRWTNTDPDYNIDHRRIPNVLVYLDRHARRLTNKVNKKTVGQWQAGDIVLWVTTGRGGGPTHLGIVSDKRGADQVPYAIEIHPVDRTIKEYRRVDHWPVTRHFRWELQGRDITTARR